MLLTEVKEDLTSIDPMKEVIGDANVYGLLNAEDLAKWGKPNEAVLPREDLC